MKHTSYTTSFLGKIRLNPFFSSLSLPVAYSEVILVVVSMFDLFLLDMLELEVKCPS